MEPPTTSQASSATPRCILHVQAKQTKKQRLDVLPFGETQWAAVQRAARKRRGKRNFTDSVYFGVVQSLPDEFPSESDVGYHVQCYKNFTAVTGDVAGEKETSDDRRVPQLRSSTPVQDQQPSSSGILPPLCLFCNKSRKRLKNGAVEFLGSCETLEASANIQEAASKLNDQEMLSKVTGADLVAKEAKYHHSCKSVYLMTANRSSAKKSDCRQ